MSLTQSISYSNSRLAQNTSIVGIATVILGTLWFDISHPLGVAGGVPYVVAIVICWQLRAEKAIVLIALLCTVLTWVGYYYSDAGAAYNTTLINRFMASGIIWITSGLIVMIIKNHRLLEENKRELDNRVKQQTIELNDSVENLQQVMSELRAQSDKLEEGEKRYRMAIDNSPIGIALVGLDGQWISVNNELIKMLGYKKSELLSKDFQAITHPEDLNEDLELVQKVLKDEVKSYQLNKRYFHKNGETIWTQLNVSLVRNEKNEPLYFVSQIQDISSRLEAEKKVSDFNKKLEEEVKQRTKDYKEANQLYKDLYHNSPDMYASVSTATKCVVECNETFLETLGYQRDEVIGHEYYKIYHPDCYDDIKEALDEFIGYGVVKNAELALRHKSGKKIDVLLNVSSLKDAKGNILESRSCWQDVTERKEIEEKVHELNKELNLRLENLDMVNKELETFSYSVSHDLRSPLRTIHGFCQALEEDYAQELPDEAKNYLQRVTAASIRMGNLIDDLLALSRITRKEFVKSKIDLSVLAETVGQDVKDQNESTATITVKEGMKTKGDIGLIRIVLENLIGNSIKYASPERKPMIEVGARKDSTAFYVKDNGVGFDIRYADKMFGAFQRLHSDKDFEGTGIGLATVNRIINRHNGKIWAVSEVDKGSTFFFTLKT